MKHLIPSLAFLLVISFSAGASPETDTSTLTIDYGQYADSIANSLNWQKGKINLADGIAALNVPAGFRYLGPEQSRYVLEDLWGNLKAEGVLGMLFPENLGPLDDKGWAFVITYEAVGYVSDDDADDIDYDELAKQMKEDSKAGNEERLKHNLATIDFLGWAETPSYDKDKKVLFWAKELKSSEAENHLLNYYIRILGRKGVLNLNAVANMSELNEVKASSAKIIAAAEFTDGNRYADFDSKVDEVAAWTIGGLVAGKVLAKAGFFALIIKFIKPIALGVIALGGALIGVFRRKKKAEEAVVTTDTGAENNQGQ